MTIERRAERRRRTLLGAKLAYNHRQCLLDCVVRNVSENGALVVFPDSTEAPEEFELHIQNWDESYSGTAVWRAGRYIGTKLAPLVPPTISLDEVRRRKALERENRRLRARQDMSI